MYHHSNCSKPLCKKCKPNEAEGDSTAALRVCRYATQSLFTQDDIGIIQQILLVYETKLFGACTLRSEEYSQQVDNIHLTRALFHLVPEFCPGIVVRSAHVSRNHGLCVQSPVLTYQP
jgi:hypothetical protein